MRELRNIWRMIGRICLMIGAGLLTLYLILGVIIMFGGGMIALLINGAAWSVLGGVFLAVAHAGDAKRARLKREGLCFEAEITSIVPNYKIMIRLGPHSMTANAECRYINLEGKTCLVRSGLILVDSPWLTAFSGGPGSDNKGLAARVYVNRREPRDYYVEIREKTAGVNADYDYR